MIAVPQTKASSGRAAMFQAAKSEVRIAGIQNVARIKSGRRFLLNGARPDRRVLALFESAFFD